MWYKNPSIIEPDKTAIPFLFFFFPIILSVVLDLLVSEVMFMPEAAECTFKPLPTV